MFSTLGMEASVYEKYWMDEPTIDNRMIAIDCLIRTAIFSNPTIIYGHYILYIMGPWGFKMFYCRIKTGWQFW